MTGWMEIAIVGAGRMGGALARLWHAAGHRVTLAYSRHPDRLERTAREIGPAVRASTPADAVRMADVTVLATHWDQVTDALGAAGALDGALDGRILVDCTNPMSTDDTHLVLGLTTSGGERVSQLARGARVVKAFNTAPSELLMATTRAFTIADTVVTPSLPLCGDDPLAKAAVARLVRDAGFDPVDVGALACARYLEPFGLLVAAVAYDQGENPEVGVRFLRH